MVIRNICFLLLQIHDGIADYIQRLIHNAQVGKHKDWCVFPFCLFHFPHSVCKQLQLIRFPHIVLVTKANVICPTVLQQPKEVIPRRTKFLFAAYSFDLVRVAKLIVIENGDGFIR